MSSPSFSLSCRPCLPVSRRAEHVWLVLASCQAQGLVLSYEDLAERSRYSVSSVKRAVGELIEHELLEVSKVYREKRNCYTVRGDHYALS